jgi:hypothetical protein
VGLTNVKAPWYVQYLGSEFGPFQWIELKKIITSWSLSEPIYLWQEGMDSWMPFDRAMLRSYDISVAIDRAILEFREARGEIGLSEEHAKELRAQPRGKLVAIVLVEVALKKQSLGICNDFSSGGVQVLSSKPIQLTKGTSVKLEIVPVSASGLAKMSVNGTVVWVRGVLAGIRFASMTPKQMELAAAYLRGWRKSK